MSLKEREERGGRRDRGGEVDSKGRAIQEVEFTVPEVPDPKTAFPYGCSEAEWKIVQSIAASVRGRPFVIGQFCEATGLEGGECVAVFQRLCDIGCLRCPVNDGGTVLFELIPELQRRLNVN